MQVSKERVCPNSESKEMVVLRNPVVPVVRVLASVPDWQQHCCKQESEKRAKGSAYPVWSEGPVPRARKLAISTLSFRMKSLGSILTTGRAVKGLARDCFLI